jgi:CyaY protein
MTTAPAMDETRYLELVAKSFRRVEDALEEVDPSDVDCTFASDVLTLTLKNGVRCVINTQRPTRQVWVAARASAWHFSWDEASGRWLDDRKNRPALPGEGPAAELFATLRAIVKEHAGLVVPFGA